ncbi:MAG TPA: hypothetical protein VK750_04915 [Cytophagaceae bacterium]|jgi:hypothetical protein|nr:hypothetical protein [Cytophagaceae bacterium]
MKYPLYVLLLVIACRMSSKAQTSTQDKVDDVVFGIYCESCKKQCAIMYHYTSTDSTTLYVDSTDNYFQSHKLNTPLVCHTPTHDREKIEAVRALLKDVPDDMLYRTDVNRTFGCPDCSDQCGIYMEFTNHQTRYRFYIDTDTSMLNERMGTFVKKVKSVVEFLKSKSK